ncbi:hypothetical protein [Nocardia sp. NBC_01327]|uniref:hypothetical protein n=1 Tax=Nocardia sp. NBC_01327 TaxID=2903593 RepID=UPI002E1498F5|nr:hypothetical protein OG326_02825 [Nocardia sp. NBC_01327]
MDLTNRQAAHRVGYAMGDSGMDLRTLAARSGFSEDALAQRLSGTAPFQLDELVLIAGLLGRNPLELLPDFGSIGDRPGVAA